MKPIYFILLGLVIGGCSSSLDHSSGPTQSSSQPKELKDSVKINLNLGNPALYGGGSNGFMGYIQALYKTGQFEEMIKYTSSSTITKYGRTKLLKYFSSMDFSYNMKLKSQSKINDSVFVMNYECDVMATKVMKRFTVVVEGGGSCKWVIDGLK